MIIRGITFKAAALLSVLLSLMISASSIAEGVRGARASDNAFHTVSPVPSNAKRKRPVGAWLLASLQQSSQSALLAIVNQPEILPHQRNVADTVLRTLPSACREHLQHFAVLYDKNNQRGLGGKTTIIIDGTVADSEFMGLLTHECGHVIHGNLLGNAPSGASGFRDGNDVFFRDSPAFAFFALSWNSERVMKAGLGDKDFVSGYAKSDAFEDFAETFTVYALHRPAMRQQAKVSAIVAAKLQWMEIFLPLPENALGQSTYAWNGSVPWDATKLP